MIERIRVGRAEAELLRRIERPDDRAARVGVTGGIGSGKSAVSGALAGLGGVVADADAISREILEPGGLASEAVVGRFGPGILKNGRIDRAALAARVFSDPAALAALERITHPLIARRAAEILAGAPIGGLAVYDVPLLVETGMADEFDAVIVVSAPLDLRLERLAARGVEQADALSRAEAQASDEQRRAVASIWIDNVGTPADLRAVVEGIAREWL